MRAADGPSQGIVAAVRHALAWLVAGNAIGVMLAVLLLVPTLNPLLGEWTYGRWMMVHMNIALFGWVALPMVAFLFHVYGAEYSAAARWRRPSVWLWSAGLLIGSFSWLAGASSGKLFLDWSGYARVFFPLALLVLWSVLAIAFARGLRRNGRSRAGVVLAKAVGLLALLAVPFALYFASSPDVYPFINPDTGGPTGQSQLESSLGVVLILLFVPPGIAPRRDGRRRILVFAWLLLAAEFLFCASLGRADVSHRVPSQWIGLGCVLPWVALVPAYYRAFLWHPVTRAWRFAMFAWWALLVLSGWIDFLPGVLDRFKFTDVLVGHSLVAVAGFLSAFLLFALAQLLGEHAWIVTRSWSFLVWNLSVLAYVVVITIAGVLEAGNPAFTIVPGVARNVLYVLRLVTGIGMLVASIEWLHAAFRIDRSTIPYTRATEVEAA